MSGVFFALRSSCENKSEPPACRHPTLSCGVHSVSRRNGLWPCPGKVNASTDQYGGLPQANLSLHLPVHLRALAADIERHIPEAGFDGAAVLDFECFGPLWSMVNSSDIGVPSPLLPPVAPLGEPAAPAAGSANR